MTPELLHRAMTLHYQTRILQARRGIDACRAMGIATRNLRWSREAADWQDVLRQAERRLAELAERPGVGPEDHANS